MNKIVQYFLSIPVSLILFVVIVTLFVLYHTGDVTVNCKHTFLAEIQSFFMHVSWGHITRNIVLLFLMSRLEYDLGSVSFLLLFGCIIVLCALMEYMVRLWPSMPCSIGMAGVFLALALVEIITDQGKLDWNAIAVIAILVLYPNFMDPCSSLTGYVVGAIAGVIMGYVYNKHLLETLKTFRHSSRRGWVLDAHNKYRVHNPLDKPNKNINHPFRYK